MAEQHLRQNPEWQQYSDRKFRYPNQFGSFGDDGDGLKEIFCHKDAGGEALVVEGVNCTVEEVAQLKARGAVFPLETAEPERRQFFKESHI